MRKSSSTRSHYSGKEIYRPAIVHRTGVHDALVHRVIQISEMRSLSSHFIVTVLSSFFTKIHSFMVTSLILTFCKMLVAFLLLSFCRDGFFLKPIMMVISFCLIKISAFMTVYCCSNRWKLVVWPWKILGTLKPWVKM